MGAKVAIGRRSQDWGPPFCGHMTNLRKGERGRVVDERKLKAMQSRNRRKDKRGRNSS